MTADPSSRSSLATLLALNRTVAVVLLTVLLVGMGENLWRPFMPAYLKALASPESGSVIGWQDLWPVAVFAFLINIFEGCCYVGGGQLTARLGDRGSLLLFGSLTVVGYVVFLTIQSDAAAVLAALLIVGWEPLSVPVTFTTVGSTVKESNRGMAFAVQSIQKRLPRMLGPALAGFVLSRVIAYYGDPEVGRIVGMQVLVGISLLLALVTLAVQACWMPHHPAPPPGPPARDVLRQMHPTLRRLLVAEILTRWCDWLVREYVVLYVLFVRGVSDLDFGLLMAAASFTSLCTYLPIGRLTQVVGGQPFIGLTFVFFALFPLSLALMPTEWLLAAFIVYGLREIGEPARKALITSLWPEAIRARGIGYYWGTRTFAMCWSSLVGGVLWYAFGPETLLFCASGFGCAGAVFFHLFCRTPAASASP